MDPDFELAMRLQAEFDLEAATLLSQQDSDEMPARSFDIAVTEDDAAVADALRREYEAEEEKIRAGEAFQRAVAGGKGRRNGQRVLDLGELLGRSEEVDVDESESYSSSSDDDEDEWSITLPDGIITKHNLTVAGVRNAKRLESRMASTSGDMAGLSVSDGVYSRLVSRVERSATAANRARTDRADHSTHERVVDPEARMSIFRLMDAGVLDDVGGAVASGKESVVYSARLGSAAGTVIENCPLPSMTELAIKVYDQRIESFRNRMMYIGGERRFRRVPAYNHRKLVKLWAEKELRNLKRLSEGGVRCPTPLLKRKNVLLMEFIGCEGAPAPRLRAVPMDADALAMHYAAMARTMRDMYCTCHLVHADLSEYNVLVADGQLVIIDVAQSVERDHPFALEYLRRDCVTITAFFRRQGAAVLPARSLFDFVVAPALPDLDAIISADALTEVGGESDAEFLSAHVPPSLSQLSDSALHTPGVLSSIGAISGTKV